MTVPTPVTLVTGFLGAGKTTLLNHLLAGAGEDRIVVIENEFGDVDIDGGLVDGPVDALFALTEGCVCCSVRADLVAVFEQLRERDPRPDHVIVEASGLADPGPVLRAIEPLQGAFEIRGVVAVVDARHIERDLDDNPVSAEQIAFADLLVLNKIDLQAPGALQGLEARLRAINPLATVVRTEHARVSREQVLGMGGHDPSLGNHDHDHGHDHDHDHDESILSVSLSADADVDLAALDQWLGDVGRQQGTEVLRMKGLLAIPGLDRRFVFHGVRDVLDVRPDRPWGDARRRTHLVIIGRGLDQEVLQAGFARCLQHGPSSG